MYLSLNWVKKYVENKKEDFEIPTEVKKVNPFK